MKETGSQPPRGHASSFRRALARLLLVTTLASCVSRRSPSAGQAAPSNHGTPVLPAPSDAPSPVATATPAKEHRVGTVRVIGDAQRFVLVEVPVNGAGPLPSGLLLRCSSTPAADAPADASLRVSTERQQQYVVADVVSGAPQVGDAVYVDRLPGTASSARPAILPTATSGVLPIPIPGGSTGPSHP